MIILEKDNVVKVVHTAEQAEDLEAKGFTIIGRTGDSNQTGTTLPETAIDLTALIRQELVKMLQESDTLDAVAEKVATIIGTPDVDALAESVGSILAGSAKKAAQKAKPEADKADAAKVADPTKENKATIAPAT